MIIETKEIKGDLTINEDTQFNHINARIIIVKEGVMTRLYGTINGDIYIEKGATVYLHGKIRGKINNDGGILYLFDSLGHVETY